MDPTTASSGGAARARRRRTLLLLALALALGALAAGSVRRREAALQRILGPPAPVLLTRAALAAGAPLAAARPVLRELPRRFVPPDALTTASALAGARAAVALPAGSYVTAAVLRAPGAAAEATASLGPGERVAQVLAHADPAAIVPGAHVDVLVTRDAADGRGGATDLAMQDVEVLAARRVRAPDEEPPEGARVLASLRVSLRQAVYLAAAQSFARDVRLLARAPEDRDAQPAGYAVGADLR
jgi:pilus assembly protein CpaB